MSFAVTNNSEECDGGMWTYFTNLHEALACLVNTIGKAHAASQPIGRWHIEEIRDPFTETGGKV